MQFKRSSQVAEVIKREMSDIISNHIKDPRLGFVTVTGVDLSDDLRYAKVYVSVYGEEDKRKESLQGLSSAKGFIRREMGSRPKPAMSAPVWLVNKIIKSTNDRCYCLR